MVKQKLKCWRKIGNNYVKGKKVLNIQNKYKVNKLIGQELILYDFSKYVDIPKGRALKTYKTKLKTYKTKPQAIAGRMKYMQEHDRC